MHIRAIDRLWFSIKNAFLISFLTLTFGASDLCAGVSLKTQELYALVFACRYLDIFTNYVSLYNTVMKLIFLGSSFSIVWYMRYHKVVRRSYDKDQDTFRHYFLVLPCLVLALLINERFTFKEVSMHLPFLFTCPLNCFQELIVTFAYFLKIHLYME